MYSAVEGGFASPAVDELTSQLAVCVRDKVFNVVRDRNTTLFLCGARLDETRRRSSAESSLCIKLLVDSFRPNSGANCLHSSIFKSVRNIERSSSCFRSELVCRRSRTSPTESHSYPAISASLHTIAVDSGSLTNAA